jgi:trk system potassium uptake protein TrkH
VNYRLLSKILGIMLLLLSGAMGACFVLGFTLSQNMNLASQGWVWSAGLTATCGLLLRYIGRRASAKEMLRKDAIGLVGIGWIVCSLFAALPYLFCPPYLNLAPAIFESVSGLTTTGATGFENLSIVPATILLWRSITEWLGGMGILAMFVLVSSSLGAGGKSLFRNESSMHSSEAFGATIKRSARWMWLLYVSLTLACIIGLRSFGMNTFQAVNHGMTTVATGGFSTENDSIHGFNLAIKSWIIVFMIACGISFPLYLTLIHKRSWKPLNSHEEVWAFLALIVLASAGIAVGRHLAGEFFAPGITETIHTVFNVVSISTGTGYAVGDYNAWPTLGKGVLLVLMMVGGCAGSTSGGLKVSRIILLLKIVRSEIQRTYRPNLVVTHRINGRPAPDGARGQLLAVFASAAIAGVFGSSLLVVLEPNTSVQGCITAVISALSNTGPAFAEFGPTKHYSELSSPAMVLLSSLMVLGRLEYIALLVLLSRKLWKRF